YIATVKAAILNDLYPEAEAERAYLIDVAEGAKPFDAKVFYSGAAADPETLAKISETRQTGRHLDGRLKYITIGASMVGRARLDNLQHAIETVLTENIQGDILECGVWRGGASAFAKTILAAHGSDRAVWLADSFEGLPPPERPEDDIDLQAAKYPMLAIPQPKVQALFERLGLMDDRVRFLKGWFNETLPDAPVETLAVLRLDGDYYESTITPLDALYDKVSPGGFIIIDDYGLLEPARRATEDFRTARGITTPVIDIDGIGVYWRK
ncbi:MAG: TylF/MycF/NovP-related O-methyltransferase, partial [Pseudomonadota bacterium]